MPRRRSMPRRRASSAPRASACAAPSTCSSTPTRIAAVRQMILADDEAGRRAALAKLLPDAARRFRRAFRDHGRAAGAPSACSIRRCTNSCRTRDEEIAEVAEAAGRRRRDAAAPRAASCTSSTRCSAIAAAASASPIPRSTRCRRAPSSRRPADGQGSAGEAPHARDHDPAGRHARASSRSLRARDRPRGRRRCSPRRARASNIWSAP